MIIQNIISLTNYRVANFITQSGVTEAAVIYFSLKDFNAFFCHHEFTES